MKCANCCGDHPIADCKRPRLALADRQCYICGKKHMARDCPENPKRKSGSGAIRAVEEPAADDYCFGLFLDHQGFEEVAPRRRGKPVPAKTTLADFMPWGSRTAPTTTSNSFSALGEVSADVAGGKIKKGMNIVDNVMKQEQEKRDRSRHISRRNEAKPTSSPRTAKKGKIIDEVDETDRQLSERSAADFAFTKLMDAKVRTVKEIKSQIKKNEPNNATERNSDDDANLKDYELIEIIDEPGAINVIEEVEPPQQPILAATEKVKVRIAADTGCVAHAIGPKHLPDSVQVTQCDERLFVGAQGGGIDHYGEAQVRLQQEDGSHITNTFQVLDVCRPLHSISMIADSGHDMVFTKKCGIVVPEGVLDEVLARVKHIAEYPRAGGLYVAEMMVEAPRQQLKPTAARSSKSDGSPATFAGQGRGR